MDPKRFSDELELHFIRNDVYDFVLFLILSVLHSLDIHSHGVWSYSSFVHASIRHISFQAIGQRTIEPFERRMLGHVEFDFPDAQFCRVEFTR
jgi:hypothetical protein